MKKIAVQIAGILLVIVLYAPGLVYGSADQKVVINATPPFSFIVSDQRVYLKVLIRIERHPDNRLLHLEWDAPDGEAGSSIRNLEGEDSPIIFSDEDFLGQWGLNLPAGHYQIRAILLRVVNGEEKRFFAKATIKIVRAGEEED